MANIAKLYRLKSVFTSRVEFFFKLASLATLVTLTMPLAILPSCQSSDYLKNQNINENTKGNIRQMNSTDSNMTTISLNLEYENYKKIYSQLIENESLKLNGKLKNRGEAHITVITPPEMKALASFLTFDELKHEWDTWSDKNFKPLCIGQAQLQSQLEDQKTFYIVVEAEGLLGFRKHIESKYKTTGSGFKANLFFPHITLGFTHKDLHYEQGIIKDRRSCQMNLQYLLSEIHFYP